MSGQLIFFVVVASMFGGIALAGLAVFLYFLYKAIQRLTVVAEAVHKLVEPMAGSDMAGDILKDIRAMTKVGKTIADVVVPLTEALVVTNKMMMGTVVPNAHTEPKATSSDAIDFTNQESFFVAPTETEQAHAENVEEARKMGLPVDNGESDSEPPLSGMVGSEV